MIHNTTEERGETTMALNEILSLGSAILFALALWSGRLYMEGNIVFYFQIVAYLLLALSSWLIAWYSTAFVLTMCAVTLFLKTKYKYSSSLMLIFSAVTLVGGLLLNNHGWIGVLPVVAAVGVVMCHVYRYREHMPLGLFPKDLWEDVIKYSWVVLSKVDNANRMPGHVLDLFLENIVGVVLWGLYAREIGDDYQLYLRGIMLVVNAFDFIKRMVPFCAGLARYLLPTPKRSRRRGMAVPKKKLNWII